MEAPSQTSQPGAGFGCHADKLRLPDHVKRFRPRQTSGLHQLEGRNRGFSTQLSSEEGELQVGGAVALVAVD